MGNGSRSNPWSSCGMVSRTSARVGAALSRVDKAARIHPPTDDHSWFASAGYTLRKAGQRRVHISAEAILGILQLLVGHVLAPLI